MIIYRKSDLKCVGTGMDFAKEIALNVIPNFGGAIGDYAFIETELTDFHLERNGDEVVAVANAPQPTDPVIDQELADAYEAIVALNERLAVLEGSAS